MSSIKSRVEEIFKELTVIPSLREGKTLTFKTHELANALGLLTDAMKTLQDLNIFINSEGAARFENKRVTDLLDRWERK